MQSSNTGYFKEKTTVGLPRDLPTSVLTYRKPHIAEDTGGVAERVLQKLKHLGMDEESLGTGCNDIRQSLSLNSSDALAVATGFHPTEFDRIANEKFQQAMKASTSATVHAPSGSNVELVKNHQENKTETTSEHNNSETVMALKQQSEDESTDMSEELTETTPSQQDDVQEGQQGNSVVNIEKRKRKKKRKQTTKFGELETAMKDIADIVRKARLGGEDRNKEEYTQKIESALRDVYARVQIVLPQNQDTQRESANISACTKKCSSSDGDHNEATAKEDRAVNIHQQLGNQEISVPVAEQLDEANTLSADDQQEPLLAQGKEESQASENDALQCKSENTIEPQGVDEDHEDLTNLMSPAGKSGKRRKKKRRRQVSALGTSATNGDLKGDEDHDVLKTKAPGDENRAYMSSEDKEGEETEKGETYAQYPSGEPHNVGSSNGSRALFNTNENGAKNEEDNTITIRRQLDTSEGGSPIKNETASSVSHTENKQQVDQAGQVTTSREDYQTKHRGIPNDHIKSSMVPAGPGHNVLPEQKNDITKRKRKKKKKQKQSTAIDSNASAPSDDATSSQENCGLPAVDKYEVIIKEDEAINTEHDLKNSDSSLIHEHLAMFYDQNNTQDKANLLAELEEKTIGDNKMSKKEENPAAAPDTGTTIKEQSSYEESSVVISNLSFKDENRGKNNNAADKDSAVMATQPLDRSGYDEPIEDANEAKGVPDYTQDQLNITERSTDAEASELEGQNSSQGEQLLVPNVDDHDDKMSPSVPRTTDSAPNVPLYIATRKKRKRRSKKKGNQTAEETNNEDNFTAADDLQISGEVKSRDEVEYDNNSNKEAPKHKGTEEEICLQSPTSESDSVPSSCGKHDVSDGNEKKHANDEGNVATLEHQPNDLNDSESGLPAQDEKETGVAFEDTPNLPQLFQNHCNREADQGGEQPTENSTLLSEEDQTLSPHVPESQNGDNVTKERLFVQIRKRGKRGKQRRHKSTEAANKSEATNNTQNCISQSGDGVYEFGEGEARKTLDDPPPGTESNVQEVNDDFDISHHPVKDEAGKFHSPDNSLSTSLNQPVILRSPTEECPVINSEQQISIYKLCLQIQDKHQGSCQAQSSKSADQVIEPKREHIAQHLPEHHSLKAPFQEKQLLSHGVDDPIDLVKPITNKGENGPGKLRDDYESCVPIESKQDGTRKHGGNQQPLVPNSVKGSYSVEGEIKESFLHTVQKASKQLPVATTDIQPEREYTEEGSINSREGQESPSVNSLDGDINGDATVPLEVTDKVDNVSETIDIVQGECAAAEVPNAESTDAVTESSYGNGHNTMADIEKKISQPLSTEEGVAKVTNTEAASSLHEVDKEITSEVVASREETDGVKIVHKAEEIVQDVFATAQTTLYREVDEVKVPNGKNSGNETQVDQEKRVTEDSSIEKDAQVDKDSNVDSLHSSDTDNRSIIVNHQLKACDSCVKGFEDVPKAKTLFQDNYLVQASCINENSEMTEEKHEAALPPLIVSHENVADSAAHSKDYPTEPAVQSVASHSSDHDDIGITGDVGKMQRPQNVRGPQNEISGETNADEVKTTDTKHTLNDSERMVEQTSSPTKDEEDSKHEISLAYNAKEIELQSVKELNNEHKKSLKESKEQNEFTDEAQRLQKVENYIQEMCTGVRTLLETGTGNNTETTVKALHKGDKNVAMNCTAKTEFTDDIEILQKVEEYINEMYGGVTILLETDAGEIESKNTVSKGVKDDETVFDGVQQITDPTTVQSTKSQGKDEVIGQVGLTLTTQDVPTSTQQPTTSKINVDPVNITQTVEASSRDSRVLLARVESISVGKDSPSAISSKPIAYESKNKETEHSVKAGGHPASQSVQDEHEANDQTRCCANTTNEVELKSADGLNRNDNKETEKSTAQDEFTGEEELLREVEVYIQDIYADVHTLLQTDASVVEGKDSGSDCNKEVVKTLNKESCGKSMDTSFLDVNEQMVCVSRANDTSDIVVVGDNETAKEIPEDEPTTVGTKKELDAGILKQAAVNEVPKSSEVIKNLETEKNVQQIPQSSDVNALALSKDSIDKDGPQQLPQRETISVTGVTTDSTMATTDTDHSLASGALPHMSSDTESASLPISERLAPFINFISLAETRTTDGQKIVILDPTKIPSKREFSGKKLYKNVMEDLFLYTQRFIQDKVQTDSFVLTVKSFDERRARLRSRKWALRLYKLLKDRYSVRLTKCILFKPSFKLSALTKLSLPFVSVHMRERIVIVKSHHDFAKAQGLPEEPSD